MRKNVAIAVVIVSAIALSGCGPRTVAPAAGGIPEGPACTADTAQTLKPNELTIGTGNPAYPPWFDGGQTDGTDWKINNPASGKGFESAVAYAIADEMGYTADQVHWEAVPFGQTFAPGPRDFDFAMEQISYKPKRAEAVDFSSSYYDVNQAVVTTKGSAIDGVTSVAELKDAKLGTAIGTTSLDTINEIVQPTQEPGVYDDLNGAVQDLKNGTIDGVVVDLPTAFYISAVQIPGGKIIGQFPAGAAPEYFGLTFAKGSPLLPCVNTALAAVRASGKLDAIQQQWLSDKASAPVLAPAA